jgi:hypothetical protein
MHVFYVKTRRWPTGEIISPTESTTFSVPPGSEENTATPFIATSPTDILQFLFWHTGRRLTGRCTVHWNFTTMSWSVWEATKWYGVPGGGNGGTPRIHAEAFNLMTNSVMSVDTPIASTVPAGAWPFMGNNNDVGTASAVDISALDPLSGLNLCGWQKLVYGGDPDPDPFIETDADVTASNVPGDGSGGVFVFTPGATLHANAGENAEALAAYGSSGPGGGGFTLIDFIRLIERDRGRRPWDIRSDPAPWDIIRRGLVEDLIRRTQPGGGDPAGGDFNKIIAAIPNMSADDLKRTLSSVKTQAELGATAVSAIEAQLKKLGKTK